ncbi:MAG: tetratricopeptide repeat protein [bacterium]
MRKVPLLVAGLGVCIVATILGFRVASKGFSKPENDGKSSRQLSAGQNASPADRQIISAQSLIEQSPSDPRGFNLLSAAFMQKARETGDFGLNAKAEAALKHSFELKADDYDALKLRAKLLLTYHRFSEALEVAKRAQTVRPQDHDVYGALTDAQVELGDYEAAVEATQKMVDLRPDTASYARVSYLRYLYGDTQGAVVAMREAAEAASPQDPESVAWCRVQLGKELINAGQLSDAEREFDRALYFFPDYHAALAAKAQARFAAGDLKQAVDFYERAQQRVPLPDYSMALGDLYTKLGREREARKQYELVEFIENAGAIQGTYSRQLALFWANHDQRLDEALSIAEKERRSRWDIYTCDLLAWCLYKKGRLNEAKMSIDEALQLGSSDPLLFFHSGMIANARGDHRLAAQHLKKALAINPSFDILQADVAKRTLESLR